MLEEIKLSKSYTHREVVEINSLNLAFIGDAVWTLMVREYFCEHTNFKNNNLHKLTTRFVKASYQSVALENLQEILTIEEKDVARRARNTKMNTVSKNSSIADYKKATGFEAVIGYLYLLGNFDRIRYFFSLLQQDFMEAIK